MLFTVLVFLVILSILILVHEIGHFTAAKRLGIRVEEFGFGFPPRIFGIKIGETVYSINWLPIGGFVRLYGEDHEGDGKTKKSKSKDEKRAFYAKPTWVRAIVLLAGVFMNFTLAIIVFSYVLTQGILMPVDRIHVEGVEEGSPAKTAGLQKNDIISEINGIKITNTDDFLKELGKNLGKEISLAILRGSDLRHYDNQFDDCQNCEKLTVNLTPRKNPPLKEIAPREPSFISKTIDSIKNTLGVPVSPKKEPKKEKQGPLGAVISSLETKIYPWYKAPFYGLQEGLMLTYLLVNGIGATLWKMISFQGVSKDVAGPIGIAQITGQAVRFGRLAILELLALLSLNLAIVNILPFPALDGGRLLFVVIEAVTGKKIKTNWEKYVHQIGMVILLLLMLLITANDIARVLSG